MKVTVKGDNHFEDREVAEDDLVRVIAFVDKPIFAFHVSFSKEGVLIYVPTVIEKVEGR